MYTNPDYTQRLFDERETKQVEKGDLDQIAKFTGNYSPLGDKLVSTTVRYQNTLPVSSFPGTENTPFFFGSPVTSFIDAMHIMFSCYNRVI